MNQFVVVQTTTFEGPAGQTFVTDSLFDALVERSERQKKTKDTWVVAEVFPSDNWLIKFFAWLKKKFQ